MKWLVFVNRFRIESGVKNKQPTTQLEVKTVLNRIQRFAGFIYCSIRLRGSGGTLRVEVEIDPHRGRQGKCATCLKPCPGYDVLARRRWLFVPLWGLITHFFYSPRRVECREHGVGVEHIPWSQGKRPVTTAMMGFLARWARRMSWKETAQTFQTSWESVYHSVAWFVQWGLAHRVLDGVASLGIDEIHWGQGKRADQFLTVIYQIDQHCRRLLWVGRRRTKATLELGLNVLGPAVLSGLRYVCSDMWQPYLAVVAKRAGHALHILDRFHIVQHLNKAVDEVRRAESTRLRGQPIADRLKHRRWKLLRRGSRVRGHARIKLDGLLKSKLATGRAWHLKECFDHFWKYTSTHWAGGFLDYWCARAMRSRLEPMKKMARMLRRHDALLLNWFKGQVSYCT
jgi:transposase